VGTLTATIPSSIASLRYIKIFNSMLTPSEFIGTVDDVQFWNQQSALDHENKWRSVDE